MNPSYKSLLAKAGATVWFAAAVGLWLAFGWRISPGGTFEGVAAEFPVRALTALAIVGGFCGVLAAVAWRAGALRAVLRGARIDFPTGIATALVAFVVLCAMAPGVESDGLRYHLTAVQEWRRAGSPFVLIPYNANSNLAAWMGFLTWVLAPMGLIDRVYQLLTAAHLIALVIVGGSVGRCVALRLGARRRDIRLAFGLTALALTAIPTLMILGAWPFADVPALAYLMGAVWVLCQRRTHFAWAVLWLSLAVATKISLLPVAGLLGLIILARGFAISVGSGLRCLALSAAIGFAVLGPWLAKNAFHHGNPVYPLAFGVLGGPEWSAENESAYKAKMAEKGMGRNAVALALSPLTVTLNWPAFEGQNPGPLPLALLPLALGAAALGLYRRRPRDPILLLAVVIAPGWIVWFFTYQSTRFLLPQLVAVVVLGVSAILALLRQSPVIARRAALTMLALGIVMGAAWMPIYQGLITRVPQAAVGAIGEDVFIAARFNAWPAVLWLNEETTPGERVFYIGEHRGWGARNYEPLWSDWFDTPLVLTELRRAGSPEALLASWRAQGIRYVLLNQAELGLYEAAYFAPRFTPAEYAQFRALREGLLTNVVWEQVPGIYICRLDADKSP